MSNCGYENNKFKRDGLQKKSANYFYEDLRTQLIKIFFSIYFLSIRSASADLYISIVYSIFYLLSSDNAASVQFYLSLTSMLFFSNYFYLFIHSIFELLRKNLEY